MFNFTSFYSKTLDTLSIYWQLVRIIIPIVIVTRVLQDYGVIRAVSSYCEPFMTLVGLPPELAFAWLTGLLVGIWGAVLVVFSLVPASAISVADITVLSALLLFAHAIPMEQQIVSGAGPRLMVTSALRIGGGFLYAFILHQVFTVTGWLSAPVAPSLIPTVSDTSWSAFLLSTIVNLAVMLVILLALSWLIEILKVIGIFNSLIKGLELPFRFVGIESKTVPFAAIGLLLGISYGGGLLLSEARSGKVSPRQIFLACVFMGFAHSIIEDTLVVVAIGADFNSVFFGRIAFALIVTALLAALIKSISDRLFFAVFFQKREQSLPLKLVSGIK